jgi:hypothetical protein
MTGSPGMPIPPNDWLTQLTCQYLPHCWNNIQNFTFGIQSCNGRIFWRGGTHRKGVGIPLVDSFTPLTPSPLLSSIAYFLIYTLRHEELRVAIKHLFSSNSLSKDKMKQLMAQSAMNKQKKKKQQQKSVGVSKMQLAATDKLNSRGKKPRDASKKPLENDNGKKATAEQHPNSVEQYNY